MAEQFEFRLSIHGPDLEKEVTLPIGVTIVGREPGVQLQLPYPQVSRRHAQITCTATNCEITDLGSANGTNVNGERIASQTPVRLSGGAEIRIGPCQLTLEQVRIELAEPVEVPETGKLEAEEAVQPSGPEEVEEHPAEDQRAMEPIVSEVTPPGEEPPIAQPPSPPVIPSEVPIPPEEYELPPGLSIHSQRLINFLPGIYHNDFMSRLLALFESIYIPIEWNIDNFDLYLDPGTAPASFIHWLAGWFDIAFDPTWSEAQRRLLLKEAGTIYARRGTKWSLSRVLEIYLGKDPEILEFTKDLEPFTFRVKIPIREKDTNRMLIEKVIDINKPAHTTYMIDFKK
jgi:phage tail-like protein